MLLDDVTVTTQGTSSAVGAPTSDTTRVVGVDVVVVESRSTDTTNTTQTNVVVTQEQPDCEVVSQTEQRNVVVRETALQVVASSAQGVPGPPGPPGPAGGSCIRLPTAAPVSGHRVVYALSGVCAYASCYDVDSAIGAAGVTIRAETNNMPVDVQVAGELVEPTWNWSPGFVFLGSDGLLTQTIPSDAVVALIVGRAVTPTSLLIQVGRPVVLQ